MIPKVIFQTSKRVLEPYVKDMILDWCPGWTYLHFTDADIIDFFRENPLFEFPDIELKFNNLSCGEHRADLFRYYYLYLNGGVFLDSDAMIEDYISNIIQDYKAVFVQSTLHSNPHIFNGFICCEARHEILLNALNHMYNFDIQNPPYHIFCEELYQIVLKFVYTREDISVACYLEEELGHGGISATTINPDTGKIILRHYFYSKTVPKHKSRRNDNEDKNMSIAIPIIAKDFSERIYENIVCLFWYNILLSCGYDTYFLIVDHENIKTLPSPIKYYKITTKFCKSLDTVITISNRDSNILEFIKFNNKNTRIISLLVENIFNSSVMDYISRNKKTSFKKYCVNRITDEFWISPQFNDKSIVFDVMKEKAFTCPPMWNDELIDKVSEVENICEIQNKSKLIVGILEPSREDMTSAVIPMFACELESDVIDHVYVFNAIESSEVTRFKELFRNTDLFIKDKVAFDTNSADLLKCNCIISNSENWDLSYVALKCFKLGIPFIHNSEKWKNYGYYNATCDVKKSSEMIRSVYNTHDKEIYKERHRSLLLTNNDEMKSWIINRISNYKS